VNTSDLAAQVLEWAGDKTRFMMAIAAPPGSGKTTLAEALRKELAQRGESVVVVPMDGFHFDDSVLNARGHRARKGAPYTFDALGFEVLLKRIKACEPSIAIPVFDRHMELSRAAADIVEGDTRIVIVEGNYLLLQQEPWVRLKTLFDFTVYLDVQRDELERRLTQRILAHGHDLAYAKNWIASNDMLNIDTVIQKSAAADLTLRQ
jgi:pantothenate kinase